ncbi:C6 transcription factor [Rasamsonia emersonii CBS 393.64]|uniref:C6 transcription factor n=1 Tax=Rasamsonia emersonii (strain ATCC 16479 / CBS 393.64 / IMI 116815) TaxID=1408163 RepID=A0A0F4YPQ3_RASE3|nr:C6 transcription factor [Rasamsonia emersonii CBS 393.64]KKA19821.1 C6 transcription factor [Rasamsonia emersonii CBS 393.64]
MSHPSPKKKSGASLPPQPRQIRFVSTDDVEPVASARSDARASNPVRGPRCSFCFCERRLLTWPAACKTCLDYGYTCLGYNEPAQSQSQPQTPSQPPARISQPAHVEDDGENNNRNARATPIRSPGTPQATLPPPPPPPTGNNNQSPNSPKSSKPPDASESKVVPLTKDTLAKANKEQGNAAGESPESKSLSSVRSPRPNTTGGTSLAAALGDLGDANSIPFYDRDDNLPTSNLVIHLCELFFVHLGCSFPFLQRDRFMRDLKEKKIDTILVDAVCALAARFSPHPLLSPPQARPIDGTEPQPEQVKKSDHGQPFAHRAMTAVVDALSCPTLSVVQACLLLAYEEFGSNHDSGLWMYLGISIRMAQDLGMQKLQGLKHKYGRTGLTPKAIISGQASKLPVEEYESPQASKASEEGEDESTADERARERERVDTFWSIFFLDRVISSGTGRPVTLRDEDIELYFPLQSESLLPNGWPAPFPPLIRMIHLYGRVTDLINGIQDNNIDTDTLKRLAAMESDLTGIYQRLSPKLHFNAVNFQTYVRAQEGTNFILLHFWFHTLIVLLHQPTLLNSFGGRMQQLYPNSRELSMSSAKTIADILSFSELIDAKSFIGNPFTSQPMYIAACAFLMESAYYTSLVENTQSSSPGSRAGTPPILMTTQSSGAFSMDSSNDSERRSNTKHILLASAAKENYQRCYKALQSLETYWEGAKYILTVLDQKAKGIPDPLLYTAEEMEGAVEPAPVQSFTPSNWRKGSAQTENPDTKRSDDPQSSTQQRGAPSEGGWSPKIDPSQAIGWALTGATNSSQPNLSLLYQMPAPQAGSETQVPTAYSQGFSTATAQTSETRRNPDSSYPQLVSSYSSTTMTRPSSVAAEAQKYPSAAAHSSTNLLLGMNNPYAGSSTRTTSPGSQGVYNPNLAASQMAAESASSFNYGVSHQQLPNTSNNTVLGGPGGMTSQVGDMMIESQDIDVNTLQQNQDTFPFSFSNDFIPWLEYLPQDVLSFFEEQHQEGCTTTTPMMGGDGQPGPPPPPPAPPQQ